MHEEIFSVRFFFAQEPEFGLAGFIIPMVFTGGQKWCASAGNFTVREEA